LCVRNAIAVKGKVRDDVWVTGGIAPRINIDTGWRSAANPAEKKKPAPIGQEADWALSRSRRDA